MAANNLKKQTVPAVTVVKKLRNYDNEPLFVTKKQKAIELLEKYGLPDGRKLKNGKLEK
jgi:hypothetical protein